MLEQTEMLDLNYVLNTKSTKDEFNLNPLIPMAATELRH